MLEDKGRKILLIKVRPPEEVRNGGGGDLRKILIKIA